MPAAGAAQAGKKHSPAPAPPPKAAQRPPAPPAAVARLRDGAAAFGQGDYAAARRHLLPLASSPKGQALYNRDYVLYLLGESELLAGIEAGDPKLIAAALERFQAVQKIAGSRFLALSRARAADCLWHLGKKQDERTRAAYQQILKAGDPGPLIDVAVLRFRLAEVQARSGQQKEAAAGFRRVYVESPLHPLAPQALSRLLALDHDARIVAVEHVQRARAMTQNRRWPEALDELAQVPASVEQAVRDEVDYWLGTTYYKMRHGYEQAAEKLLGVAVHFKGERQAEAMFHGARALSRADKDEQAISGYQAVVKTHPGSRYAAEASFLAGWLEYNRGHYQEAIASLEQTIRRYHGPFAEDDRWYQGFSRYLLKDYAAALQNFQALAKGPGISGDKGRYWASQALSHLKRTAESQALLRRLVSDHPLSYYALLARVRLSEEKIDMGPFGDPPSPVPVPLPLSGPDPALGRDPDVARVDELLAAALPVEAGFELRRAEGALLGRYGAQRALPLLFDRYRQGQNFQRPYLLAEAYGGGALRLDPHKDPAARKFWEQMYPLAYKDMVEKYGPTGENPPRYLYTIMQKESAYNPHDVSYADAIGLLQMIPPTSRLVAKQIGRPYTDDVLYDPEGNIQFGAWYIGHLLRKFKGQVALGAGSFNAGPRAMLRWLKQNGDHPLDEFIELCAYTQTREYMKKVLDIYAHYVYLWDKEEYLPRLLIDKAYLSDDGIDY